MTRFIVDDPTSPSAALVIERHLKALRPRPGERFILCDGKRNDYVCGVISAERGVYSYEIIEKTVNNAEPDYKLSIYMAYSKGERLEYAVQKCTELGAAEFFMFAGANVVARPDAKSLPRKLTRLRAIAAAAAEQSGRGTVPSVDDLGAFGDALRSARESSLALLPYEKEDGHTLSSAFNGNNAKEAKTISVVTGAEGGFTEAEAAAARAAGLVTVTLGKRILRCDTAPIAVAACLALMNIK